MIDSSSICFFPTISRQLKRLHIDDMPLVSLGGFVPLAMHLFFNRKMRCLTGCRCKGTVWVGFNAILVPIVAVVLLIVFTPEESFLPEVCLEVIVPDDLVDKAVMQLSEASRTGSPGDGKIFVLPVEDAVRIRTGDRGDAALT